jgi:hypothetical protein
MKLTLIIYSFAQCVTTLIFNLCQTPPLSLLKFQHDFFFLFISNSILLEGAKGHNPITHEEKQKSRKIRETRTVALSFKIST